LLSACKFGAGTPVSINGLRSPSGFLQLQSTSGLSLVANFGTLAVHLIQPATSADPAAGGLPAPLPKFSQVYVTAAGSDVADAVVTATLDGTTIDARGRSAEPVLSRLQPSSDVTVRVYLITADGRLAASGIVEHTVVRPGLNNLDIPMTIGGQSPFLIGASNNINVSDGVIVKGATVAVSTGFAQGAPGVNRLEVELTGEAYGDGKEAALIAALTPPDLSQYEWRPSNPSGEYDPAKLASQSDKKPVTLVSKAYDPFDHLVGSTSLAVTVVGAAYVDVGVDQGR
jgi:hypothetical protein